MSSPKKHSFAALNRDEKEHQRHAANVPTGCDDSPLDGFIRNRIEQLLCDLDIPLRWHDRVTEVYCTGFKDASARMGDLL